MFNHLTTQHHLKLRDQITARFMVTDAMSCPHCRRRHHRRRSIVGHGRFISGHSFPEMAIVDR